MSSGQAQFKLDADSASTDIPLHRKSAARVPQGALASQLVRLLTMVNRRVGQFLCEPVSSAYVESSETRAYCLRWPRDV